MKRPIRILALAVAVGLASYGVVSACGEQAQGQPAVAKADGKEGCGKDSAGAKGDQAKSGCAKSGCAKGAMVAKADGAAIEVGAAEAKPCAGAANPAVAADGGCPRKAKAAETAKADAAGAVELAEVAK